MQTTLWELVEVKLTDKGLIPELSHKTPRLNHSQIGTHPMNGTQFIHSISRRFFEGAYVQVKLQDGTTIERKLVKIDSSMEHNGLGNLILEDGIIIRVSYVQHIALKVKIL
jgi:hypothetical protein